MKVTVIMGSPRLNGNTAVFTSYFVNELKSLAAEVSYITLADKKIAPCRECYACQHVQEAYGCAIHDDMYEIAQEIVSGDVLVLATPVFSWYCSGEMKLLLDRCYAMDKYYGSARGNLWNGKSLGLITTHGYGRAHATEPFEMGMKRFCAHSGLHYLGMLSMQDGEKDWKAPFLTETAKEQSESFARFVLAAMQK